MEIQEIAERVSQVIAETLGDVPAADIALSESLVDDLGFDSLDVVDLVVQLEVDFNIEISDEEVYNAVTVGDVVISIKRLLDGKKPN